MERQAVPVNKDYWLKRCEILHDSLMRQGDYYNRSAAKAYQQAVYNIQSEINDFYQRFADNNEMSYADAKRLLTSEERTAFQMNVEEYIEKGRKMAVDGSWIKELENASTVHRIERLKAIQMQMQNEVEQLTAKISEGARKTFSDVYRDSYYKNIFEAQRALGQGKAFAQLDKKTIDKVLSSPWSPDGENFSKKLWGSNRGRLVRELNTKLTQGLIRGESPDKITKGIAKSMNASYNSVNRLVLTESAYFAGRGTLDAYEQLGVKKYEFVVALDERTCETCGPLDGKVFDTKDEQAGVNYPPIHPRCRCTTVPYFNDEFTADDMRSARDKKSGTYSVPSDMTYGQWKEKYVDSALDGNGEDGIITLKDKIKSGEISLELNRIKQAPHMADTREEGKSYFTISYDQLQQILNEKYGTGVIHISKAGQIKEVIQCDYDIGTNVTRETKLETQTNCFTVHYSKTRTHCVPALRRKGVL